MQAGIVKDKNGEIVKLPWRRGALHAVGGCAILSVE
jgi:hypothetical protein